MSKEYIEREVVINTFCEDCERHSDENPFACSMCEYVKEIMKIPAADVAPVVHGEWIPIVNYFHGKPDGRYYCSVCHRVETVKGIYCRICGARMDGGNSNG